MKLVTTGSLLVLLACSASQKASGQAFINLNFEQSTIISSSPTSFGFNSGMADVPGWTEYNGWGDGNYSGGSTLVYNDQTLDDAGVELEGRDYSWNPAIAGCYSVLIQGGSTAAENSKTGAAIGQTGQIPMGAKSITFLSSGNGAVEVTFNGHLLAYSASSISFDSNYAVSQVDVSAYAGQTGQLLFAVAQSTAPYAANVGALIDNIQFSGTQVPEPNPFTMAVIGAAMALLSHTKARRHKGNNLANQRGSFGN